LQNIFEIGKPVHPVKNAGHNDEEKGFKAVPEATGVVDFMRRSGDPASLHLRDKVCLFKSDKTPRYVAVSLA